MPVLETARLSIRPFRPDDLEASAKFMDSPDAERRAYLEGCAAQVNLLAWLHQPPFGDRGVELKATGELIGAAGFVPCLDAFGLLPGFYDTTHLPETVCSTTEFGLYLPLPRRTGGRAMPARPPAP